MTTPRFGCCHCQQEPVAFEQVFTCHDGENGVLRVGFLPVGWEVLSQFDGRLFMIECPTCAKIRHERPPVPPSWIVQPDGRAYEIEIGRVVGRRLHPYEMAILRSAAGRDLLQRLEWLELRDAERATASAQTRLEMLEAEARALHTEIERLGSLSDTTATAAPDAPTVGEVWQVRPEVIAREGGNPNAAVELTAVGTSGAAVRFGFLRGGEFVPDGRGYPMDREGGRSFDELRAIYRRVQSPPPAESQAMCPFCGGTEVETRAGETPLIPVVWWCLRCDRKVLPVPAPGEGHRP